MLQPLCAIMMYNYPLFSTVTVAPVFSSSRFSISAPCSDMPSFTMQGAVSHIYLAALRSCVTRSLRHLHTCSAPAPRLTSFTLYPPGVFIASISSEQSTSLGCFSLLPNKKSRNPIVLSFYKFVSSAKVRISERISNMATIKTCFKELPDAYSQQAKVPSRFTVKVRANKQHGNDTSTIYSRKVS